MKVEGLAELNRALAELPKATARNVLKRTLTKAAQPIADAARTNAPVDTGNLRDKIIVSTKLKNKIGNAEYAEAMKSGLGKAAAVAALRNARREAGQTGTFAQVFVGPSTGSLRYAHMVEFGTVKMPPHPFIRPAWDAQKAEALDAIKREMWLEIEKAARRLAKKAARLAQKAA